MKRILSAVLALTMALTLFQTTLVLSYKDAAPWYTLMNSTNTTSKGKPSDSNHRVEEGIQDPNNSSNNVSVMQSYDNSTAGTMQIYKTLSGNENTFYSSSGATASAGSGVSKMDLYFEDMAAERKTAPRFAHIVASTGTFAVNNFNTFNVIFDKNGNIMQNLQAGPTSSVNTSESSRVKIGEYSTNRWYRLVQEHNTANQTLTVKVYDITDDQEAFVEDRVKNVKEIFEAEPIATALYYIGYGGLAERSASSTGDNYSKGATVLGISGVYIQSISLLNTPSTVYVDNMMAGPSTAAATLAMVNENNEAEILKPDLVEPSKFIGKNIQLRLSQPLQNEASVTSVQLRNTETGEVFDIPRMDISSTYTLTSASYPQILEFEIPGDLTEGTYEFLLNSLKDIHGQSFANLLVTTIDPAVVAELEQAADDLSDLVSQLNDVALNQIDSDIILPTENNGISIEWTQTTDAATLALDGTVNQPPFVEGIDNSKDVTLTAVLSKGGASITTQLVFTVLMREPGEEYHILKAAYDEFLAEFEIPYSVITDPIEFPDTWETAMYPGRTVEVLYDVKGRLQTTTDEAKAALHIEGGTSIVKRPAEKGKNVYATIDITFRFQGAADRNYSIDVEIPYQNLLSSVQGSELTDARPTYWDAAGGDEKILTLDKTIVIGEILLKGTNTDKAAVYFWHDGAWTEADDNLPLEASKIKIKMQAAGRIEEVEAFSTPKDIADIDISLVTLPKKTVTDSAIELIFVGKYKTAFAWTSSNPSVIDQYGTVTQKSTSQTVTLTVGAKQEGLTDKTKSFTLTVAAKSSSGGGGGGGGGGPSINVTVPLPTPNTTDDETQETNDMKFSDMKSGDWAAKYVSYLAEKGIFHGKDEHTFAPNLPVLREEFVKVALLAFQIPIGEHKAAYTDVDDDAWYAPYVKTASDLGVVKGYGDRFGIGDEITREDIAVILHRIAEYKGLEITQKQDTPEISDLSAVRGDAKDSILALVKAGIISGYEDKTIRPKSAATRAETAKLIYSMLEHTGLTTK